MTEPYASLVLGRPVRGLLRSPELILWLFLLHWQRAYIGRGRYALALDAPRRRRGERIMITELDVATAVAKWNAAVSITVLQRRLCPTAHIGDGRCLPAAEQGAGEFTFDPPLGDGSGAG